MDPSLVVESGPAFRLAALGVACLAALAFLYRAAALWVWNAWTTDPYLTHGLPVALTAVALAGWRLWKDRDPPAHAPGWAYLGLPLAGGAYLLGLRAQSAHLVAWSGLGLAAAVALATGGPRRLRLLAAPLLLLALALPIPGILEVGVRLQDLAFAASAGLLTLFGLPLERGLTTFATGGITFDVTAACSGFQSAVALLAVGAVLVAVAPMPPARARLVLLAAVPLALALNVARILLVVWIGLRWGAEAANGFFHGASDLLLFLAETAVLVALSGQLSFRRRARAAPEGTPE